MACSPVPAALALRRILNQLASSAIFFGRTCGVATIIYRLFFNLKISAVVDHAVGVWWVNFFASCGRDDKPMVACVSPGKRTGGREGIRCGARFSFAFTRSV